MDFVRNLLVFLILYQSRIEGYRILGIFPFAGKSHNIFFDALMKGLVKAGHQVDVMSHYELQNPSENYTMLLNLSEMKNHYVIDLDIEKALNFQKNTISQIAVSYGNNLCEMMASEKMQRIFKEAYEKKSYDVVISEFFGAPCFFGLGHFLQVPVVAVSSFTEPTWVSNALGIPFSSAFFPTSIMDVGEMKTFSHRLQNSFLKFLCMIIFNTKTEKSQTEAMQKYLRSDIPSIRQVEKSIALLITNNFQSLSGIRPVTPALVEIGGLHIFQNDDKLTPELKMWMDESTSGVVYFSLGTAARIETLPKEKLLAFYSSFAKISPVRVLVRIKDSNRLPPGLPENVKILPWIPQIPLLGHKNARVFITQCGLLGLQETLYFGVPIIGIPLHSDQFRNVQIFVKKGMGIRINYEDITEKNLDDALNQMLHNSSYREAIKYESRIFRDRQAPPIETANYWIEYIIKYGANSLRSPAVDLKWWQLYLLDVYSFLLLTFLSLVYLILVTFKIIYRKISRTKEVFANGKLKVS